MVLITPFRLLLTVPLGGGIIYLHNLSSRNIGFTWQATPGHAESFSSRVLNPANGPVDEESYIFRIPSRELTAGITDEEVLARFSKGFFGGWIFTPERWIAPFARRFIDAEVIDASRTSDPKISISDIWELNSLSRTTLPPLGATLFGLLTLFDTSACTDAYRTSVFPASATVPRPSFEFAEYAGRTKRLGLAASHRFEVVREFEEDQDMIRITFSHVRSNPRTGGQSLPSWFIWFHVFYSKLLFADGIREVLKG